MKEFTFNFDAYQKDKEKRAERKKQYEARGERPSIGYFALKNDKDVAYIRFANNNIDEITCVRIHQIWTPTTKKKVVCINPFREHDKYCPFCDAANNPQAATELGIAKASSKAFLKVYVSYEEPNGNLTQPEPVIWERPLSFLDSTLNPQMKTLKRLSPSRDFSSFCFKVTRNGSGKDTTYQLEIAEETSGAEEVLKDLDFTVFDTLDLSKHNYTIKSNAEMTDYINKGLFEEETKPAASYEKSPFDNAPYAQKTTANSYYGVEETPVNGKDKLTPKSGGSDRDASDRDTVKPSRKSVDLDAFGSFDPSNDF